MLYIYVYQKIKIKKYKKGLLAAVGIKAIKLSNKFCNSKTLKRLCDYDDSLLFSLLLAFTWLVTCNKKKRKYILQFQVQLVQLKG